MVITVIGDTVDIDGKKYSYFDLLMELSKAKEAESGEQQEEKEG